MNCNCCRKWFCYWPGMSSVVWLYCGWWSYRWHGCVGNVWKRRGLQTFWFVTRVGEKMLL